MRRGVLGLLGALCVTMAMAHVTGSLRYSEYPKIISDAFARPKDEPKLATNVTNIAPTTPISDPKPTTVSNKPEKPPIVRPPTEKPRPTAETETGPEKTHRITLEDLPGITSSAPATKPLVPKEPPTAPVLQNYAVSAAASGGQSIGYFPAGATITFRGKGAIAYGIGAGTAGPIGDIHLPMGPDPTHGRPNVMYHGALCLLVPADPAVIGFKRPSEWVSLPWKEIGGGIWEATYTPARDMNLSVLVADSRYNDNGGWYDLTVEWSPAGGNQ